MREGHKITPRFLRSRSMFGWKDDEISSDHAEGAPRGEVNWSGGLKLSRDA